MSSGKVNSSTLIGGLIAQRDNIVDGIKYAQEKIKGTMSLLILTEDGIIAARDKNGQASYYNRKARRRILCFL